MYESSDYPWEVGDDHLAEFPQSTTFRLAKVQSTGDGEGESIFLGDEKDEHYEYSLSKSDFEAGGDTAKVSASVELKCVDCGITMKGDSHFVTRTTNVDPFREVWINGKLELTASLNIEAELSAKFESSAEFNPIDHMAIPFLSMGTKLGPVTAIAGGMLSVHVKPSFEVGAKFSITYSREAQVRGPVNGHVIYTGGGYKTSFEDGTSFELTEGTSQVRFTREGCRCKKSWTRDGYKETVTNYCGNPDKSISDWCFIDGSCPGGAKGRLWDYCAPLTPSAPLTPMKHVDGKASLEAKVAFEFRPTIHLGIYAKLAHFSDDNQQAFEASLLIEPATSIDATFKLNVGEGNQLDPIKREKDCSVFGDTACCDTKDDTSIPYCPMADTCAKKHDSQLSLLAHFKNYLGLRLMMHAGIGDWRIKIDEKWWWSGKAVVRDDKKKAIYKRQAHFASYCWNIADFVDNSLLE